MDNAFAVKDRNGYYFIGYNKWDKQLRNARLYHSYKFAKETRDDPRFIGRDAYVVKVEIGEMCQCDCE